MPMVAKGRRGLRRMHVACTHPEMRTGVDVERSLQLLTLFPNAFPRQAKNKQRKKKKKKREHHQASLQSCEVGIISPFGEMGEAARAASKLTVNRKMGRGSPSLSPAVCCWLPLRKARRTHSTSPLPVLGKKAVLHEGSWKFPE